MEKSCKHYIPYNGIEGLIELSKEENAMCFHCSKIIPLDKEIILNEIEKYQHLLNIVNGVKND